MKNIRIKFTDIKTQYLLICLVKSGARKFVELVIHHLAPNWVKSTKNFEVGLKIEKVGNH